MALNTRNPLTSPIHCLIILIVCLAIPPALQADLLKDEDVLWSSGSNLYIKLVPQDKASGGKTPPNQHPVQLEAKQVTEALNMLRLWQKPGEEKDEEARVFSVSQARLLGTYLSTGLARAKSDQDITFGLSKLKSVLLGVKEPMYMAGRAFYLDDRLHIIIGDYDKPRDKGKESTHEAANAEYLYFFTVGQRGKASSAFKKNIVTGDGIEGYTQGNKLRRDWFVIDVPEAAKAYAALLERKQRPAPSADTELIRQEAARLARERREMRAEMARLRKEMTESGTTDVASIEERLAALDELREKNLISGAEYDRKRQEILDDI